MTSSSDGVAHEAPDIDYTDWGEIKESDGLQDRETVREALLSANPGDRIKINTRARPLEVITEREAEITPMAYQDTVFLKGNGTYYRVKIRSTEYPKLDRGMCTPDEYVGVVSCLEVPA